MSASFKRKKECKTHAAEGPVLTSRQPRLSSRDTLLQILTVVLVAKEHVDPQRVRYRAINVKAPCGQKAGKLTLDARDGAKLLQFILPSALNIQGQGLKLFRVSAVQTKHLTLLYRKFIHNSEAYCQVVKRPLKRMISST